MDRVCRASRAACHADCDAAAATHADAPTADHDASTADTRASDAGSAYPGATSAANRDSDARATHGDATGSDSDTHTIDRYPASRYRADGHACGGMPSELSDTLPAGVAGPRLCRYPAEGVPGATTRPARARWRQGWHRLRELRTVDIDGRGVLRIGTPRPNHYSDCGTDVARASRGVPG
jgi:hypothetical protein